MPQFTRPLVSLVCLCLFFASCETIKGVGRDIESVGEKLEDAVD